MLGFFVFFLQAVHRHSRAGGNLKAYCITIPNQVGNDDATILGFRRVLYFLIRPHQNRLPLANKRIAV